MSRHLTAAVPVALLLTGCGGGAGPVAAPRDTASPPVTAAATDLSGTPAASAPESAAAPASPTSPTSPTTGATRPAPVKGTRVAVYYLGPGGGANPRPVLYREFRDADRSRGAIRAAVEAMLRLRPLDADYESLWPRATRVNGVTVDGEVATVDLSAAARSRGAAGAQEEASVQQLVHTVTAAAPGVTGVRLRFDGRTEDSLWGHVDTTGTLRRAPHRSALGAVWVVEPAYGSRVARTFTVAGVSSTFEAGVAWHVTRPGSGDKLAHGVTMGGGAPGRGPFSVTVTLPAGTRGDVVFTAFDWSEKDGSVLDSDTKTYRVV